MEAIEFRINNLVKDQLTGEFMKISDLSENKISAEVIDRSKFPLPLGWKMIPIPLTEEILLKCGFTKRTPNGFYFDLGIISINVPDFEYRNIRIKQKVRYLHQLQNLYFALKGQELEINL